MSKHFFHAKLISPSRAQEEEKRARVTRAEQESLSLHTIQERRKEVCFCISKRSSVFRFFVV